MALDDEIAGLRCAEVLAALGDYVDGELPAELRAQVEAHVGACRNCERFGAMYGGVIARLRAQLAEAEVEPGAFERLRRRLDES